MSYANGMPRDVLMYKTVAQAIEEAAIKWPNKLFVASVHQNMEKTFKEVNEHANQLAHSLLSIGVTKGDRVGIWSVNCYEWVVTQFATAKIGAILVNVNPAYRSRELIECVNSVELSTLISCQMFKSSNYVDILEASSRGILHSSRNGIAVKSDTMPSLKNVIYIEDGENEIAPVHLIRFGQLIESGSNKNPKLTYTCSPDDICNIQFTSGTTGSSKAASLTNHNIVNNAYFTNLDYFHDSVICVPNPLYHCFGCVMGTLAATLLGNTIVLPSPVFSPTATLNAIDKYKCYGIFGTPTMYMDLINAYKCQKVDLSSIKYIYMAGSPCVEKLTRDIKNVLFSNLKRIVIPYGTTEASPVITMPRLCMPDEYQYSTVGSPIDYAEVKIVHPNTGYLMPRGKTGELWTRSIFIFPGYWNLAEKTAEVIDNHGWYKTGDLAYMTEDGYIYINGRIKDMIIRGGENVYPREIENLILTHEAVADVNVVGVADERLIEQVAACVILKNTFAPSEQMEKSIICFCKGQISHYKVPRYILFMQQFPRTVTHKVQKGKLKEIAEALLAKQVDSENNLIEVKNNYKDESNCCQVDKLNDQLMQIPHRLTEC